MDSEVKPIGVVTDGIEMLTAAILEVMRQYSALTGEDIYFEELGEESGIAFSASDGALIISETEDVLGGFIQRCQYPFFVVYRTSSTKEYQKLEAQKFLDSIGKWICGEPADVKGKYYALMKYPALTRGRKIVRITRKNSYPVEPYENGVQDWILPVTVEYTNEIEPKW